MSEAAQIKTRDPPVKMTGPRRRPARLAWFGLLFLAAQGAMRADELVMQESQVKAAFLYNFTKFIEWPAQSFGGAGDPIVIGVYCSPAFATELSRIVHERRVNGRTLVVKQLERATEARAAHLLFICSEQDALFAEVQAGLQSSPVLTVGESRIAASHGAAIVFVLEQDKVRFEIDMAPAQRAGVKISAQLQKLAKTVRSAP